VARDVPRSVLDCQPKIRKLQGLHVAKLEHVIDVHERVHERCTDDELRLVHSEGTDTRLPAVGLVSVAPHNQFSEVDF
jgi:hypothetical protein